MHGTMAWEPRFGGSRRNAPWPGKELAASPDPGSVTLVRCCPHVAAWGQHRHGAKARIMAVGLRMG